MSDRIKDLEPQASNRAIAEALGVAEGTIRNDQHEPAQSYAPILKRYPELAQVGIPITSAIVSPCTLTVHGDTITVIFFGLLKAGAHEGILHTQRGGHGVMNSTTLYDTDFAAWTAVQIQALRSSDWGEVDVAHLAEEIESLAKRDAWAIKRHLKVLMLHLLKWRYQRTPSARHTSSWRASIRNARDEISLRLDDTPSLRRTLPEAILWAYPRAREDAADETGIQLDTFPVACPWTEHQLLDRHYYS